MKGRERKMPITTIIIGVLVILVAISGWGWYTKLADCERLDKSYAELRSDNSLLSMENIDLQWEINRKDTVIAELEKIKGVKVSEVTYYAPTGYNTASGTAPEVGRTIAVDPSLIPLGSEVYIEGIGWRKAEDTGPTINGSDVDVFVGSEIEAQRGGRVHRNILWRTPDDN